MIAFCPKKSSILMVSKPIAPPWNDSSKNLVKDLALSGSRFHYHLFTTPDFTLTSPEITCEPIYQNRGSYSPSFLQNIRVMGRLFRSDSTVLTHFFFAPHLRAAQAAKVITIFRPRVTIQTVCSIPKNIDESQRILFANHVIVLSRHTQHAMIQAGISESRLTHIPPGIKIPKSPSESKRREIRKRLRLPLDRPIIIYAGDYQYNQAAYLVAETIPRLCSLSPTFIYACRLKGPSCRSTEQQIRQQLWSAGAAKNILFFNEVEDMISLLAACDLCLLPSDSLYAKMDLPLVLIESMAVETPIIIADVPPLNEIDPSGATPKVRPNSPEALATEIGHLLRDPQRMRNLGKHVRGQVVDNYDIRTISRRYEELYQDILDRNI